MDNSLPDFSKVNVLVVGDVMLDKYWYGNTSRVSPEAPVPVVHVDNEEYRAGGAGNVAINISRLGGNVSLLGLTGRDLAAKELSMLLEENGVDNILQEVEGYPTITKLRVISRQQQLIRLDFENGFHEAEIDPFYKKFEDVIASFNVLILSDYGKGALWQSKKLIDIAKSVNPSCKILVDPKGTDFSKYAKASIITPNRSEFEAVVGKCKTEKDFFEKGTQLLNQCELESLLVTRGEEGMTLLQKDSSPVNLPTQAQEVFDVTGAGDTVISVLGASLAAGKDLVSATSLANLAAGIVVGKLGTASVTTTELQDALYNGISHESTIFDEESLLERVKKAKQNGEKIVMTNGCFDILHAGHVSYLQEAASFGDRLIIAVNTDESVKTLKGDSRPINNLQNRMAVLAGLKSVDWVIPFSEETPERVISKILPDILVKGGDYKVEDIAGGRQVIENGGEVNVLRFVDGCSTTNIINAIRED